MSGPHDREPQQPPPPEDELDDLIWLQDTRQDRLDEYLDDQP